MGSLHTDSSSLADPSPFPKKYQFLRETNAFKDLYRIRENILRKKPFDEFKSMVKKQVVAAQPDAACPNEGTLRRLYERGVDAAVDRVWVQKAKDTKRSRAWKTHGDWVRTVIELSQSLEPVLKRGDGDLVPERDLKKAASIAKSLSKLRARFFEIKRFDERLVQIASTRNRNSLVRLTRTGMDKILLKECPGLKKTHRVALILLAMEWTGLNPSETEEAVSRQLSRAQRLNGARS
jgi:hypothetical protein